MKRWMAFLLACVLLLTAVPVPARAEQMEEQEIVGLTEEPDQNTQNSDVPVSCVHQYESVVTEPNCTQEGYTTYACVLCGDTYVADYTEAKGCNTTWMPPVPATCTQEGIKGYYTCSRCLEQYWDAGGKSLIVNTRDLLTPTVDHTMGPWEDMITSTPDELGTLVRQCQNCDYNETTEAEPLPETLETPEVTVTYDEVTGKPILSWKKVEDAQTYWIYQCDPMEEIRERLEVTEELEYLYEAAEGGEIYHIQVIAANETACSLPCDVENVSVQCEKPVVKVSRDSETGKPMLTWAAVEGAAAYEVYRATDKKTYTLMATVEEAAYLDTEAVVDKTYQYQVKAIGTVPGTDSILSNVVSHTCDCARPVPVAVPGTSGGIQISWEKIEGGKKYTVYRATSENGTYKALTTTTSLSYLDKGAPKNKVSYYKVDVFGASTASFSDYSEPVAMTNHTFGAWKTVAPSTPEIEGWQERTCTYCGEVEGKVSPVLSRTLSKPTLTLKTDATTGKPVLSWGSVKNATKYQIYYLDEATGEQLYLGETTAKTYTHAEAETGMTHAYTVIAVNNTQCSDYADAKGILCICAKPVLKFTRDSETGKPIASWAAVEGASAYELYLSTNKKTYELIATVEGTSYLVEDAIVDKTHYYRVKAVGEMPGIDSTQSAVVSHTCDCARPVAAATYGENGGIKISWEKVEGGKKYTVYRSTTENGVYAKVGTTTAQTYTDTKAPKNKISYYKVDVYGASTASFSDYSEPVSAMNHTFGAWKTIIPSTPETEGLKERTCTGCGHLESRVTPVLSRVLATPTLTVKNDSTTGKPVLSWGSVKKATKYQIFLVDTFTGERTFLEEVTAKTYTHKTAVTGQTYTYAVIAVNDTQCGNYSAIKSIACICAKPVVKIIRDSETGKPIVTWEQVEGAAAYEIYMSTNKKTYTLLASVEETSYLVEDAVVDKTYYYQVKAVGELPGTDSVQSAVVSHTCDCARPVVTANYAENGGITISWEKVTGGKKYTVYRSTTENGVYSKIGTTSNLSYTDTKAPKNKVSYYKVDVYGSSTASFSDYSEPVSAINHTFGAWVTTIPSTPTEEGWQERSCTVCHLTEGKVKPVLKRSLGTPTLTVKNTTASGKPVLSWGAVKNATEYWVYLCGEEDVFLGATTEKTFTHSQAQANQEYTYKVMAVSATACGNFSDEKTVLCKLMAPELRITNDPDSGLPTVSWNRVDGAVEYALYWSQKETSGYELYAVTSETSIFIDQAAGGKSYYKIQAYHESNELANSELSGAYANVCKCRRPEGVTAGMVSETFNKVTWEAVTGATSYEVYRATEPDGTYTKITTTSYNYYLDSNLPAGHGVYYYQVTAMTSLEGTTSARSEAAAAETLVEGLLKVYVSPSSQTDNKYAYGNVTEAAVCREISLYLVDALTRCGISAITNVQKDMYGRVPESNAWGADLHIPLHTNAFTGSTHGTQIYYKTDAGRKVAKAIFNQLAPIVPGTGGDSVRKVTDLYEITKCKATVAYIEAAFHDNATDAKWIIEHKAEIAEAICQGVCDAYGIPYIAP